RIAETDALDLLTERSDELAVDALLHEQARTRRAHFALIGEGPEERAVHRGVEIRVLEDDVRILATELDRHALDRFGRALDDESSGVDTAREGDLVDAGIGNQRRSGHRPIPRDDVEDTLGEIE